MYQQNMVRQPDHSERRQCCRLPMCRLRQGHASQRMDAQASGRRHGSHFVDAGVVGPQLVLFIASRKWPRLRQRGSADLERRRLGGGQERHARARHLASQRQRRADLQRRLDRRVLRRHWQRASLFQLRRDQRLRCCLFERRATPIVWWHDGSLPKPVESHGAANLQYWAGRAARRRWRLFDLQQRWHDRLSVERRWFRGRRIGERRISCSVGCVCRQRRPYRPPLG